MSDDVYVTIDYDLIPGAGSAIPINNRPTVTISPTSTTQTVTYDTTTYTGIEKVIVSGVTPTFTNATTTAANNSGIRVTVAGTTYNISSVTVPSGKTFTVTNNGTTNITNSGTTNVNGGLADKGVQVKSNKEVIVDNLSSFPVTYATTTTVNGTTYQAGDLKVPVLSGTTLEFPSGFATPTTLTATVNGTVTIINGAVVKDVNALHGSGTTPTSTTSYNLVKWTGNSTLGDGPHVTVSSSAASGGSSGDWWIQVFNS